MLKRFYNFIMDKFDKNRAKHGTLGDKVDAGTSKVGRETGTSTGVQGKVENVIDKVDRKIDKKRR